SGHNGCRVGESILGTRMSQNLSRGSDTLDPVQDVSTLKGDETGFYHLRGRIVRVGQSRSALWLNLKGGLAIRITWRDWSKFAPSAPKNWSATILNSAAGCTREMTSSVYVYAILPLFDGFNAVAGISQ
ncbi:MAG: hypothetical protein KZQ65_08325, partial [Candidatus Thiodiazotropha sp. (ex Gloverina cf. vestifex)]|nr:hypothetical protein [Candidatus Thiodiazotropha sp. (ex Gloverina cf. vestifex)]